MKKIKNIKLIMAVLSLFTASMAFSFAEYDGIKRMNDSKTSDSIMRGEPEMDKDRDSRDNRMPTTVPGDRDRDSM